MQLWPDWLMLLCALLNMDSGVESFLNSVLPHVIVCIIECGFWCGIILHCSPLQVAGFWRAYCSLPVEQQEWDASQKLRSEISQYRELLPLLKKLHSKVSK